MGEGGGGRGRGGEEGDGVDGDGIMAGVWKREELGGKQTSED